MTLLERMAQQGHVGRGLLDLLRDHAKRQPVHTTLRGLVHHGRHARSGFVARNLREQLCVRLSHQAERLRRFPKGEGTTYHLEQLLRVHVDTFQELHDMGGVVERIMPGSREQSLLLQKCDPLDDFRRCIDAINNRHTANVETLMEAKREASRHWEGEEAEESLQQLIDEFLQMHISFQLLCRHFLLSLKTPDAKNDSARTGMVAEKCLLRSVVADAVGETQLITEHHLADSPDVIIEGDVNARATCIPSHVHHILFEVLKNALRATAVKHGRVADSLPPVRVRIAKLLVVAADPVWPDECAVGDATARSELGPLFPVSNLLVFLPKGKEQASVTVSDQGGGMGLATTRNAFRYLWTSSETYHEAQRKHRANASYQPANDPLSGMGIGLPLSRLYARHFGGDLGMLSLQGYGTHVALFMPLLEDGVEHLPSILR